MNEDIHDAYTVIRENLDVDTYLAIRAALIETLAVRCKRRPDILQRLPLKRDRDN